MRKAILASAFPICSEFTIFLEFLDNKWPKPGEGRFCVFWRNRRIAPPIWGRLICGCHGSTSAVSCMDMVTFMMPRVISQEALPLQLSQGAYKCPTTAQGPYTYSTRWSHKGHTVNRIRKIQSEQYIHKPPFIVWAYGQFCVEASALCVFSTSKNLAAPLWFYYPSIFLLKSPPGADVAGHLKWWRRLLRGGGAPGYEVQKKGRFWHPKIAQFDDPKWAKK